jgi:preprotein translocase subunit YajC
MNTPLFILLQSAAGGQGGGSMLVWLILIMVVMWLLMIRPQQKQAKKEREFRENLKKGDRVSFSGVIYGKVHEIAEHTIDVEIANGVVVTVEKSMVTPISEQNSQQQTKK